VPLVLVLTEAASRLRGGASAALRSERVVAAFGRWIAVAGLCLGCDFVELYLLIGVAGLPPALGNLIVAELSTLLRYLLTERIVFRQPRPSWRRCAQFHASTAGAFAVWWAAATLFDQLGVHYLLAAVLASGCSVGVNFVAHFGWIWRRRVFRGRAPAYVD